MTAVPWRVLGLLSARWGILAVLWGLLTSGPATVATTVGLTASRWSGRSGRAGLGSHAVVVTRCDLRDGHERTKRAEGEVDEVRGQFHAGLSSVTGVKCR